MVEPLHVGMFKTQQLQEGTKRWSSREHVGLEPHVFQARRRFAAAFLHQLEQLNSLEGGVQGHSAAVARLNHS